MSDISRSICSPILRDPESGPDSGIDLGQLLRYLLIFDRLTIETSRFQEITQLAKILGVTSLLKLIESGAIQICMNAPSVVCITGGSAPKDKFGFAISQAHRPLDVTHNLEIIRQDASLSQGAWKPLKRGLSDAIRNPRSQDFSSTLDATLRSIAHNEQLVKSAVIMATRRRGLKIDANELSVEAKISNGAVKVITDLKRIEEIDSELEIRIISEALAAISNLESQITKMRLLKSIVGFQESEIQLFDEKLQFLTSHYLKPIDWKVDRIVSLSGLPSIETKLENCAIDVDKLLEIRRSTEWLEFTHWICEGSFNDGEKFRAQFFGLREQFARVAQSRSTTTIRWLVPVAVSVATLPLPPPVSVAIGAAVGAADSFILNNLLPKPSPISFIGQNFNYLFSPTDCVEESG